MACLARRGTAFSVGSLSLATTNTPENRLDGEFIGGIQVFVASLRMLPSLDPGHEVSKENKSVVIEG